MKVISQKAQCCSCEAYRDTHQRMFAQRIEDDPKCKRYKHDHSTGQAIQAINQIDGIGDPNNNYRCKKVAYTRV